MPDSEAPQPGSSLGFAAPEMEVVVWDRRGAPVPHYHFQRRAPQARASDGLRSEEWERQISI